MQGRFSPNALAAIDGMADLYCDTLGKVISMKWSYSVAPTGGNVPQAPRTFGWQSVPLDFWPTAVGYANQNLYVAGKRYNGRTLVQEWGVDYTGFPASEPSFQPRTIMNRDVPGESVIRWLFPLVRELQPLVGPRSTHLLVQFADSFDVGTVDIATGTVNVVFAAQLFPDLLVAERDIAWGVRHNQLGNLYVLQPSEPSLTGPILFADSERDGIVDSIQVFASPDPFQALIGSPPIDWTLLPAK